MKGHSEVIKALGDILTNELTAINQYFLHARICNNWAYTKIGDKIYKEAVNEMKHAKEIMDRILFFEAIPNVQKLHTLNIGKTVKEMFENDKNLEEKAIIDLKQAITICLKASDFTSKELLENILIDEEQHVDWAESQLYLIKELGEKNYLSQQIVS